MSKLRTAYGPYYLSLEWACVLPSVANLREHWAEKADRTKQHRTLAATCTASAILSAKWPRFLPEILAGVDAAQCVVTLTRCAPRELDDDNLARAFKATRDGVADALGVDDRDKRLVWRYEQAKAKVPAVRVELSLKPRVEEPGGGQAA